LKKYKKKLKEHKIENEESVAQYYSFVKLKEEMTGEFNVYITSPKHCMRFLTPGRLVWVKYDDMDFGWNMVIKCEEIIRRAVTHYNLINSGKAIHKVKVLLHCSNDSFVNSERVDVKPCPVSLNDGVMLVVPIKLKDIQTISQIRLHAGENIEHERHLMHLAYETINDILSKHPTGVPLDPIKMRLIEENINKHPINQDPLIIEKYTKRLNLVEQKNNMVELKGRIACGIKSGDEIVLTELLLNDVFNKFIEPYNQILETARIVAEITEECAIAIDKEKYMAKFSPGLVESVYAWCNHVTFPETCKKGKMQGDIARNFENLDELLQEMVSAAKCIGNIELENKFSLSIEKIKKGIIVTRFTKVQVRDDPNFKSTYVHPTSTSNRQIYISYHTSQTTHKMPSGNTSTDSTKAFINLTNRNSSSSINEESEIINDSSDHDITRGLIYNFGEISDELIKAEIDTGDVQNKFSWSKLWKYTGPGFLMSIAYLDPGNLEADLQTGAVAAGLLIQCLSTRVGVVTGMHLAQLIKKYYSRPISTILWIITEIAIIGSDIQEIVGTAIALKIIFGLPLWVGTLLTAMDTFTFMLLQNYGVRKLEAFFMLLIGLMAACFWIEMFKSDPDVGGIITGMLLPSVPSTAVIQAVTMIGAVMTRKTDPSSKAKLKEANFYFAIESGIALLCSYLINMAIVVVFGTIFYKPDGNSPHLPGLYDAADALTKTLGKGARYLWAFGLLAAGQSSTMTGTLAGQYVMEGFFGKIFTNPWQRVAITRGIALVPSMMVAVLAVENFDTMGEFLNVLQSLCLPTALIPILKIISSKNIMGKSFQANYFWRIVSWLLASIITNSTLTKKRQSKPTHPAI
ncbi:11822_t:CDS:10, partial [Entrophospora sp. SA101]